MASQMDWRYGRKKRGMYIDGHERDDVVKCQGEFIQRWKEYENQMLISPLLEPRRMESLLLLRLMTLL